MRGVACPRCEVQKEGLIRINCSKVEYVLDCMVHQILGEVVALVDRARLIYKVVVMHQPRSELVSFATVESVEPFEPAAEWP